MGGHVGGNCPGAAAGGQGSIRRHCSIQSPTTTAATALGESAGGEGRQGGITPIRAAHPAWAAAHSAPNLEDQAVAGEVGAMGAHCWSYTDRSQHPPLRGGWQLQQRVAPFNALSCRAPPAPTLPLLQVPARGAELPREQPRVPARAVERRGQQGTPAAALPLVRVSCGGRWVQGRAGGPACHRLLRGR